MLKKAYILFVRYLRIEKINSNILNMSFTRRKNMDYIKYIRNLVGHKPIMLTAASVILLNEENQILLQKRVDNHLWGYCGGYIEMYEKVEDAAKRELFEETGLKANSVELFNVFSGEELKFSYPNGDVVNIIDIVFICKDYEGNLVRQVEEVEELAFFDIDKIPKELSPPIIPALKSFVDYYQAKSK